MKRSRFTAAFLICILLLALTGCRVGVGAQPEQAKQVILSEINRYRTEKGLGEVKEVKVLSDAELMGMTPFVLNGRIYADEDEMFEGTQAYYKAMGEAWLQWDDRTHVGHEGREVGEEVYTYLNLKYDPAQLRSQIASSGAFNDPAITAVGIAVQEFQGHEIYWTLTSYVPV